MSAIRILVTLHIVLTVCPSIVASDIAIPIRAVHGLSVAGSTTNCGLHSLVAASYAVGKRIDPIKLLSNDGYKSSVQGSTIVDLESAAAHMGLFTRRVRGLAIRDLDSIDAPCLIQLASPKEPDLDRHWVAILGISSSDAKIFDSKRGVITINKALLDLYWDGGGLIVGATPAQCRSNLVRVSAVLIANRLALVLLAVCAAYLLPSIFLNSTQSRLRGGAALAVVAFGMTLVTPSLTDPLLRMTLRTSSCQHQSSPELIPKLEPSELTKDHVLVDVRPAVGFRFGHLPGATNLPISSSLLDFSDAITSLPADRPIVTYCQSKQCGWAEQVANRLNCLGFSVNVLTEGYSEYQSRQLEYE